MSTQTEALRLAQALNNRQECEDEAADELRRLHQFAEDQIGRATTAEAALQMTKATHALKIADLEAQRDALLEACRFYASMMGRRKSDGEPFYMTALDLDCGDRARAAIAKAEEACDHHSLLVPAAAGLCHDDCADAVCVGDEGVGMTHITIDRAPVEQALEALNRGLFKGELIQLRERAASGLEAALAQQAEPLTEEEIYSLFRTAGSPTAFARAVERKVRGEEK